MKALYLPVIWMNDGFFSYHSKRGVAKMNRLTTDAGEILEAPRTGRDAPPQDRMRKHPRKALEVEPLLTADDVAKRLNVSTDWVWDHSSRKKPLLPVIRMGDGTLRYRQSGIEAFIDERERVSSMGRRAS